MESPVCHEREKKKQGKKRKEKGKERLAVQLRYECGRKLRIIEIIAILAASSERGKNRGLTTSRGSRYIEPALSANLKNPSSTSLIYIINKKLYR